MDSNEQRRREVLALAEQLNRANVKLHALFGGRRGAGVGETFTAELKRHAGEEGFDSGSLLRRLVAESGKRADAVKATPEYETVLAAHREAFHGLYSDQFMASFEALRNRDPSGIEEALAFLEADPWCFRSGYMKQNLIRYLRRVSLSEPQKERVRAVMIKLVRARPRIEFREYCRTAKKVDSPKLRATLASIRDEPKSDPRVKQQAGWMLGELERASP